MKRYKKAFSIENKISSFSVATAKQKTVICDILIRVREDFRNFVISSATKSDWFKTFFHVFATKTGLIFVWWRLYGYLTTALKSSAAHTRSLCTMWRLWSNKFQLKWMKNIAFDSAETYASLCQFQITLAGLLVSKNLPTMPKSDFQTLSKIHQFCVNPYFL